MFISEKPIDLYLRFILLGGKVMEGIMRVEGCAKNDIVAKTHGSKFSGNIRPIYCFPRCNTCRFAK